MTIMMERQKVKDQACTLPAGTILRDTEYVSCWFDCEGQIQVENCSFYYCHFECLNQVMTEANDSSFMSCW